MFYFVQGWCLQVISEHSLPYLTSHVSWPGENRPKETVSVVSSCPSCPSPVFVSLAVFQPLGVASAQAGIVLEAEGWQLNPSSRDTDLDLNNTVTYKTHQLIHQEEMEEREAQKRAKDHQKWNKGTKRRESWPKKPRLMTMQPREGFNTGCEGS